MFYIIIYINQVYFKVGRLLETHLKINQKNIHLVDNEMSLVNIDNIQKIESVWLISDCVYLLSSELFKFSNKEFIGL